MSVVRLATASLCSFFLLTPWVHAAEGEDCDPDADVLVARLEKDGLATAGIGHSADGTLLQLMIDPVTGDFVLVERLADGAGCPVHPGFAWTWLFERGSGR